MSDPVRYFAAESLRAGADGEGNLRGNHGFVHSKHSSASVGEVMHRGVVSCGRDTPAIKAAMMMTAHRIHAVVVTGSADLPRLVTDAEIASALFSDELETASAGDIATCAPLIRLSDTVGEALSRMHEEGTTHAVAVDRSFRPIGVVSVLDLVEARQREDNE